MPRPSVGYIAGSLRQDKGHACEDNDSSCFDEFHFSDSICVMRLKEAIPGTSHQSSKGAKRYFDQVARGRIDAKLQWVRLVVVKERLQRRVCYSRIKEDHAVPFHAESAAQPGTPSEKRHSAPNRSVDKQASLTANHLRLQSGCSSIELRALHPAAPGEEDKLSLGKAMRRAIVRTADLSGR